MQKCQEYRFSRCRIVRDTREVFLNDELQAIPPRVYDVLLHLVKHRHRVVSRDELLDEFWMGRIVVDNTVSRTIMLARTAIGDSRTNPTLIRTIQRVGYRFVAPIELGPHPPLDRLPAAEAKVGVRVGFLPIRNDTGEHNLAWVELGLLSLVTREMRNDSRLQLIPIASVLACLGGTAEDGSDDEKASRISSILNGDVVISSRITGSKGAFRLEFRSYGWGMNDFYGNLDGIELTQFGPQLAREVKRQLLPSTDAETNTIPDDPFFAECFARGMQAAERRQWADAKQFLGLVAKFDKKQSSISLEYAYILARLGDESAVGLAHELIAEAQLKWDRLLEARASYVLALSMIEVYRDASAALSALDRSIRLAGDLSIDEWSVRAYLLKFHVALLRKEYDLCSDAVKEAETAGKMVGNRLTMLTVQFNRGVISAIHGDHERLIEITTEVLHQARELDQPATEAIALLNLSISTFALGQFEESVTKGDEFCNCLDRLPNPPPQSRMPATHLLWSLCELRMTERLAIRRTQLAEGFWNGLQPLSRACRVWGDALLALSKGETRLACKLMQETINILDDPRYYNELAHIMPIRAKLLLCNGAHREAAYVLRGLTNFEEYSRDQQLPGVMEYLSALKARLSGNVEDSIDHLRAGLDLIRPGTTQAWLRLDLAWAFLEQQDLSAAEVLLAQAIPWIDAHPAGLIVKALLNYRRGNFAMALDSHEQHVALVGGENMTRFAPLGKFYRAAIYRTRQSPVPEVGAPPSAYYNPH